MSEGKLEAGKRRDALKFLMTTLGKRIQPALLRYWGSRQAFEFERSWIEATTARLEKNCTGPPETEESIWEICEIALFQTLESMQVPKESIPEQHVEDIQGLVFAELERLEEEHAIGEQMAWLFGEAGELPSASIE